MQKSSTKKICMLLGVLIIVAFGALYMLFVLIEKRAQRISDYEIEQQQVIAELDNDRSLKQFLDKAGPDIDKLSHRIVEQEGTVGFIEMIEGLARANKLDIEVAQVNVSESAVDKNIFEVLNLSLSTKGDWQGTHTFLSQLETLPYKVTITNAGLTEQNIFGDKENIIGRSWNGAFTMTVLKYK